MESGARLSDRRFDASLAQKIEREVSLLRPTRLTPELVAWGDGPDPAKFWIPEDLVPLWDTPEYAALTPEQKLRYNQYCALHKSESFIWLERYLIIVPLTRLLGDAACSPALRTLIESFIADERAHNASLRRLLVLARPDFYANRDYYFLVTSRKFRAVAALMTALPKLLSSWALFMGAVEESTITTSQCYRQAGDTVDRLFADVFMLHAQDEARHCKLDSVVAEWLVSSQTGWRKRVNARMLDLAFQTYFDPSWGFNTSIKQLVADFPELRASEKAMIRRAQEARAPSTARILVDGDIAPITARNVERFDMLRDAVDHLLARSRP